MILEVSALNWLGILFAFAAYFLLGAFWFTFLFKKQYLISLGKENESQNTSLIYIVGPAICTLVITICSAILMDWLNIESYSGAFSFGLFIGIGYLVANTVTIAINPNIPKPLFYGLISGTYHLIGILIACSILVTMN